MPPHKARTYGVQACLALFRARPGDVDRAWVTEEAVPAVRPLLRDLARRRRPYKVTDAQELARVAGATHHEGICIEARERQTPSADALLDGLRRAQGPVRLVYLDGVTNPHNLGAIVRTCAHFRASAVLGPHENLPAMHGAARRVAEGGAEYVPVIPTRGARRLLHALASADVTSVATVAHGGHGLFAAELPDRCLFVLGAERSGVSAPLQRAAPHAVTIPGTGHVESLNVSAACAVLLSEHYRRTGGTGSEG